VLRLAGLVLGLLFFLGLGRSRILPVRGTRERGGPDGRGGGETGAAKEAAAVEFLFEPFQNVFMQGDPPGTTSDYRRDTDRSVRRSLLQLTGNLVQKPAMGGE